MKISIITVCFNSEKTISSTINSVLNQRYKNIEYIIVDGNSTDKTLEIINKYKHKVDFIISEPDFGIYDAINKGILISTGEIIGILNSDDVFSSPNIVSAVFEQFRLNQNIDAIIGNVSFINSNNKIVRKISSKNWKPFYFKWGIMPPHPSFYCKKIYFEKIGMYCLKFDIASDFDLMLRFLYINNIKYQHLNINMVNMRMGGKSTQGIKSLIKINIEILKSLKLNGISTNYFVLYLKYFVKIFQFLIK